MKERPDLPPQMQELDAQIEERLQVAARKNATLDGERYQSLGGKLEYADLRELQDTITNKGPWQRFEGCFANKGTPRRRFGQLADLRNGIRHSRSVDEITRKEGEAAILWFEQVTVRNSPVGADLYE